MAFTSIISASCWCIWIKILEWYPRIISYLLDWQFTAAAKIKLTKVNDAFVLVTLVLTLRLDHVIYHFLTNWHTFHLPYRVKRLNEYEPSRSIFVRVKKRDLSNINTHFIQVNHERCVCACNSSKNAQICSCNILFSRKLSYLSFAISVEKIGWISAVLDGFEWG